MEKYQRGRQAIWDRKHLQTITTKLRRRDAEKVRRLCEAQGITLYALQKRLLMAWADGTIGTPIRHD